ncbi:PLDc N-terminal domain-containing protein [Microbacterium deminutum]|uniref:Cardiolipin synthase N-terminal domain-containing protein n=1 Tax=Microbacterium deminutum TaxID=344164 RepID=A0ABN2QWB7_9MICO
MTHKHRELSAPVGAGLAVFDILQAAFAFLAAWDLWHRPAAEVKGPKAAWVPVLLVKWIGPAAYFLFGVKY